MSTPRIALGFVPGNDQQTQCNTLRNAIEAAKRYANQHYDTSWKGNILIPVVVEHICTMWIHINAYPCGSSDECAIEVRGKHWMGSNPVMSHRLLAGGLGFISDAHADNSFLQTYRNSRVSPVEHLNHLIANSGFKLLTKMSTPINIVSDECMEDVRVECINDHKLDHIVYAPHGIDDIRTLKLLRLCTSRARKPLLMAEPSSRIMDGLTIFSVFGIATSIGRMFDISEVIYSHVDLGFTMDSFIRLISTTKCEKIVIHDDSSAWQSIRFHSREFEDKLITAGGVSKHLKEIVCANSYTIAPDLTSIVDRYTIRLSTTHCLTFSKIGYKCPKQSLVLGLTQSVEVGSDSPFHYLGCCIFGIIELLTPHKAIEISVLDWSVLGNKIVNTPAWFPHEFKKLDILDVSTQNWKSGTEGDPDEVILKGNGMVVEIDATSWVVQEGKPEDGQPVDVLLGELGFAMSVP